MRIRFQTYRKYSTGLAGPSPPGGKGGGGMALECRLFGIGGCIVRQGEYEAGIALHVDQQIVDVDKEEINTALAERGVDQHLA